MNKKSQSQYINELTTQVKDRLENYIALGKVPDTWDGHELRVWVAAAFYSESAGSVIRDRPRSKRAKDYHNTLLINNI